MSLYAQKYKYYKRKYLELKTMASVNKLTIKLSFDHEFDELTRMLKNPERDDSVNILEVIALPWQADCNVGYRTPLCDTSVKAVLKILHDLKLLKNKFPNLTEIHFVVKTLGTQTAVEEYFNSIKEKVHRNHNIKIAYEST